MKRFYDAIMFERLTGNTFCVGKCYRKIAVPLVTIMDDFLDMVWLYIFTAVQTGAIAFDKMLSPLHIWGPAPVITLLALLTVGLTKYLSIRFTTKRYKTLESDFQHWMGVREEALMCEDIEKGKRMARNIDQAKLNRVYYDYFLEGFLLSMATTCLPTACVAAYVNEFYRAERLTELFQQAYIFKFGSANSSAILVGGLFWYVVSVICLYLTWGMFIKGARVAFKYVAQAFMMFERKWSKTNGTHTCS